MNKRHFPPGYGKQVGQRFLVLVLCCVIWLMLPLPGDAVTDETPSPLPRVVLPQWQFQPGPLNGITDVTGVRVGHVTLKADQPAVIRTGVTAIVPHQGNLATEGVWAVGRMLNGNGELTGLHYINQTGVLNSPIILTNTFSVGSAHTGVFQYFLKHYPGAETNTTVWGGQLPVVGECYDGFFNTIEAIDTIQPKHTVQAIESARGGPVFQGRVGAGTGMRSFGLHAGIGTASRVVSISGRPYHIGVLVNTNHSRFEELNPPIRKALEQALHLPSLAGLKTKADADQVKRTKAPPPRQGSIIVLIATDLPLLPTYLDEMAKRAALGIGAMGSTMNTTSGDGVVVFSTSRRIPLNDPVPARVSVETLHPNTLSDIYRATVEAVTEAQINALVAANVNTTKSVLVLAPGLKNKWVPPSQQHLTGVLRKSIVKRKEEENTRLEKRENRQNLF